MLKRFKNEVYYMYSAYVQYVVLGPRVKVINLNILPESSCNELKYSLKIAFMFLSIILKFQVPDINILLGIRKKATVFDGPWSASQVSSAIKRIIITITKLSNLIGYQLP